MGERAIAHNKQFSSIMGKKNCNKIISLLSMIVILLPCSGCGHIATEKEALLRTTILRI